MSLQSACCGDVRPKISTMTEVVVPHNLSGALEQINDGLGTLLHLLQQSCSEQQQLKNLAIVNRDMMLRQERRLKEMGEELWPGHKRKAEVTFASDVEDSDLHDQKDEMEHSDKDVSSTCPRCEVPRGCTAPECRRVQLTQVAQVALEVPKEELVSQKGSETVGPRVSKAMTARSSPRFGQRFVTNETSQDTVTFEIAGLASTASPRRTIVRSARQMASSTALGRYFFDDFFSTIEHIDFREPERSGILARVVNSNRFGSLCMMVILLNAILISFMSDQEMKHPGAPTPYALMMIELGFACFYAVELLLKLAVHRLYFFINDDMRWNIFDISLVIFSGVEITSSFVMLSEGVAREGMNLTFLRLLRLCKIAKVLRVLRTLRFFRELRLMLDCVLGSVLNAIWCIAMLFFVMFIFSLLLVQGLADYLGEYSRENGLQSLEDPHVGDIMLWYGSVGRTLLTLFQSTTSGVDWRDCYLPLEQSSSMLSAVFLLFVSLFTISVWNIVTSTFVEKALKIAQPDLESLVMEHHLKDVQDAQALLELFCSRLGCSDSSSICYAQFKLLTEQHNFRTYLSARGIDIKNVEVFFRMLATASGNSEVELKVLANALVRMKGFATAIDLQTLSFETKITLSKQAKGVKELGRHLRRIERLLDPGAKSGSQHSLPDDKPTLLKPIFSEKEAHKSSLRPPN